MAAGCAAEAERQTVQGRVAVDDLPSEVLGVRAVQGGQAVAWAGLDGSGRFALEIPEGLGYRLEVVTSTGAHGFVVRGAALVRPLAFDVCGAQDDYDLGHVHGWDDNGGQPGDDHGDCGVPCAPDGSDSCGTGCDPMKDPGCGDVPPCDPMTGEGCCAPDGSGDCGEPPPPCMPDDPSCVEPPRCQPGDPNCCEVQPDGSCCVIGADGLCEPMCDPNDASGTCYCNPEDPASECYCDKLDPQGWCYCNESDPASYCYCDANDPMSWCNVRPCEQDGTCCQPGDPNCDKPEPCDGMDCPPPPDCSYDDPACWPGPEPLPCGDGRAEPDDMCWEDGVVPENDVPDFGCGDAGDMSGRDG